MNHHDFINNAQLGDVYRITRYMIGRLYPNPSHDKTIEGQEAIVIAKRGCDVWPHKEQVVLRVLSSGERISHDWHEHHHQAFELVRKGDGIVVPGVTYPFTEDELRDQRWQAFLARVEAKDVSHQGFSNAATYLAWLYLNNESGFVRYDLPSLRRKDGTVNPNKVRTSFERRGLVVDSWARECPIDIPREFAGRVIHGLAGRMAVKWQEVADAFASTAMTEA